jgi:polyhydroxyalkanoate synthesis repressor PhaR
MSEPRTIKRYANRKLYDTQASRYVTLDQIAELVRAGEDVQVIDNTSKEDLTSVTLAQIIFEEEKKKSFLPLQAMRNIIQSGGDSISVLVDNIKEGVEKQVEQLRENMAEGISRAERIFRRTPADGIEGDDVSAEGVPAEPEPALAPVSIEPDAASLEGGEAHGRVREFIDTQQRAFDEWQRRIDERIRHLVQTLSPFSGLQREVVVLTERIAQLERQITQLGEGDAAAASNDVAPRSEHQHRP